MAQKVYIIENLGCANCAAKMEAKINAMEEVEQATITFATRQLRVTAADPDALVSQMQKLMQSVEPEVTLVPREKHEHHHEEHEHHHHEDGCCCGHDHEEHEHHHHEDGCCCGHDHEEHEHHHHEEHKHSHGGNRKIYKIENLDCANCAAKIEAKFNAHPAVQEATITFATMQLRLTAEDPDKLLPELTELAHTVEPEVRFLPQEEEHHHEEHEHHHEHGEESSLWSLILGAALFVGCIVLEKLGLTLPGLLVAIAAYVILGKGVVLTAAKNFTKGIIFDENFLMTVATVGAFLIGEFPEAVGVMLFYCIGEYFEDKAVERSRSQIMDAVDLRPEVVNLVDGDEVDVIPAGDAKPGDLLLVRPGDRIPLDGVVVEGSSRIDTAPITGEPVPVAVTVGSSVISGCVNTSGQLTIRVEKALEESMVSRILDSVENAAASKPKIDRFITRFARIYTPAVVAIAAATAIIPGIVTGNWNYWVYTALSFLVMSCPCALVLSVPLAFFSGIGAGSKKGILFKGGISMEAMSKVKAVVMDKTGTLTEGNFVVSHVEGDVLSICAACEMHSTHPIAESITAYAKAQGIVPEAPEALEELAGRGIKATWKGQTVLCGNARLLEENGVALPAAEAHGGTVVLVAVDGQYRGSIRISDTVKPGAKEAVSALKRLGITPVMLTGDSETAAKAVAKELGIDRVHAKLLPHQKLEILQTIRQELGSAMFVGDGINDAPVLAGADVGAAMGSGADAAIEAADVVFLHSDVDAIPRCLDIARQTNSIAWQNVVVALTIKVIVMILGLCGFASMWLAVFADSGVAMLCVLNSIRGLYLKK